MSEGNVELSDVARAASIAAAAAGDEPQRRALKRILLAALTAVYETEEGAAGIAGRVSRECADIGKCRTQ